MPKLGTCCNSSERPHLMLFCFLKYPSRRSVGGKWETPPRFPSGPRPRLFHNQTNPHSLDKPDSRSTTLRSGRDDNSVGRLTAIRLTAFEAFSMQQNCHPDRSAPGFPATRHSPAATCAAFSKENRMKFASATKLDRKSGVA